MVIERSAYTDLRIGEHLAPAGVLQLRALDVGSRLPLDAHSASAGVEAYWGSETASHMDYLLHPGQHGIELGAPAVRRRPGACVRIVRRNGPAFGLPADAPCGEASGWDADVRHDGKTTTFRRINGGGCDRARGDVLAPAGREGSGA